MFKNNEVRKAVMAQVDERIENAQSEFNIGSKKITEESVQAIEVIMAGDREKKSNLLKDCVKLVLG